MQGAPDVLHEKEEVEVVRGAGLELRDEIEIEIARFDRLCVNEQATAADGGGEFEEPGEHILEWSGCQSSAFVFYVDTESSEESNRLGIPSGALAESFRALTGPYPRHAPCVVGDHLFCSCSVTTKTRVVPMLAD